MSTITKERIEQYANDPRMCNVNDEIRQIALIALASLEAEAVGEVVLGEYDDCGCHPYARVACIAADGQADWENFKDGTRLYTAPPVPVSVPAAMEMDDDFDSSFEHGKAVGWNAYRAAMLQGADGTLTNEGTIPVTQFKPVADLYGLTSPTGGETSFTFDAVEARDFIDGGWSCQEYVELGRFQEAMFQNGNSPAQSDCFPEQNYIAPAQDGDSPALPDGWVACSERMPEDEQEVIVQNKMGYRYVSYFDEHSGLFFDMRGGNQMNCIEHIFVTHWMPLPAAPQQK